MKTRKLISDKNERPSVNGLKATPHHTIAKNSALWKHKFKNVGLGAGEKDQWEEHLFFLQKTLIKHPHQKVHQIPVALQASASTVTHESSCMY